MGVPPRPGGTKDISTAGGPWGFGEARQRSLLSFQLFYSNNNIKKNKSKHGKIFCLPECGARSFSCPLKLSAHAAPWIPKSQQKKPLQNAHFSPASGTLLWLSFMIPPSTGKMLLYFSVPVFLYTARARYRLTHTRFNNSDRGQAESKEEWQTSGLRCRLAL